MHVRGFRRSRVRARHAFTASLDGHNSALCQEGIRHAHGLFEQTAGVAAEIQHNSLKSALWLALFLCFGQSLMEFLSRLFRETGHVHPVIPVLEPAAFNADKGNGVTDKMHLDRLLAVGVQHGQIDARILGAAQAGNDFLHGHFLGGLAVYEQNDVTGLHAGLEGRRVLNGRHDGHLAVLHGKFDADAEKLTGRRLLHLLVFFCAQKRGMRIEALQHSLNGPIDKIALAHFLHVGLLNDIKNLAETADRIELACLGRLPGVLRSLGFPGSGICRCSLNGAGTHTAAAADGKHEGKNSPRKICAHEGLLPKNASGILPFSHGKINIRRERQFPAAAPAGQQKKRTPGFSLSVNQASARERKVLKTSQP